MWNMGSGIWSGSAEMSGNGQQAVSIGFLDAI